ncbi:MAG TPA: hypothetical protein VFC94_01565 [Bacteroidaceae bacterium]|nr:hypothetical protein [Bacteroidaceae bacterium]
MRNRTSRANQNFMFGSFLFMGALLLIIFMFLMWAFKIYKHKDDQKYSDCYEIVIGNSALNAPLQLYINDSLLFNGTPASPITLSIERFSENSTILAIDVKSDEVTLLPMPPTSGTVTIEKEGSIFTSTFISKTNK